MINFVVKEMTALRYFIPLVDEAGKRDIRSCFYVGTFGKYNCPIKHERTLMNLCSIFRIEIRPLSDFEENCEGLTFFIEGVGVDLRHKRQQKRVSLTYMTDFVSSYNTFIDKVDHVVFPSKKFAEHYSCISDKNLYLGSPKYDCFFDDYATEVKHKLPETAGRALMIYPKQRDVNKIDVDLLCDYLGRAGFWVITKTRGKDPLVKESHGGDLHLSDEQWYPHTTLELIRESDIVVNFNSTVIKECVMLDTPLINFDIKPFKRLDFLYDYDYCIELPTDVQFADFNEALKNLTWSGEEFKKARKECLFEKGASRRILETVM